MSKLRNSSVDKKTWYLQSWTSIITPPFNFLLLPNCSHLSGPTFHLLHSPTWKFWLDRSLDTHVCLLLMWAARLVTLNIGLLSKVSLKENSFILHWSAERSSIQAIISIVWDLLLSAILHLCCGMEWAFLCFINKTHYIKYEIMFWLYSVRSVVVAKNGKER